MLILQMYEHRRQILCLLEDIQHRIGNESSHMKGVDEVLSILVCFYVQALVCFVFALRDGIRFAFRDPQEGEEQHLNVSFLEVLSEFSFKLLQQDRAQL